MKLFKNILPMPPLLILICGAVVPLASLRGAPVVFTVDPAQSEVTLSGTLEAYGELSAPITQQSSGSLTAVFGGSLNAEVSGSTIQFTGSSLIAAQTNGMPQQPLPGGASGSAPADYGGMAQENIFFSELTVEIALRNVGLDVTSPSLMLTNGEFGCASLEFLFSSSANGTIDYYSPSPINESGSAPLTGDATDASSTAASLTTNGNVQVLTIPVNMTYTDVDASGALEGTTLNMVGQLVATATNLPPPMINSITVSNQTVVLTVANATAQSQVLASPDLVNWTAQTASVTALTNRAVFSFPVTTTAEFFRVKQ